MKTAVYGEAEQKTNLTLADDERSANQNQFHMSRQRVNGNAVTRSSWSVLIYDLMRAKACSTHIHKSGWTLLYPWLQKKSMEIKHDEPKEKSVVWTSVTELTYFGCAVNVFNGKHRAQAIQQHLSERRY